MKRLTLVVGVLVGALARNAAAEPADTERARALFDEAGELERHGQWTAAQERLRAALRLRETPQLYYALGWALENDDKLLDAKTEYDAAVRLGRERPNSEEVLRLASARLVELDKKIPSIRVRVGGGGRATARVLVDGREIHRDDDVATTIVNPGSHVVRVERVGDEPLEQMVYVGRSTVSTVEVEAAGNVAARDTPPDRHTPPQLTVSHVDTSRHSTLVPWLLVSGGVAFVASGAILLVAAGGDRDTRDANRASWCAATACTSGNVAHLPETATATAFRRRADDAASAGSTKQGIGLTFGGIGIVSAAVGAILLLRKDGDDREHRGVTASGAPLPGGGIASASLAF